MVSCYAHVGLFVRLLVVIVTDRLNEINKEEAN